MSLSNIKFPTQTKRCLQCKTIKTANEFYYNKRRTDELSSYCKKCSCLITKHWIEKNPERNKINKLRWYRENSKHIIETTKRWIEKNPERYKIMNNKSSRAHQKRYPDREKARALAKYARKKGILKLQPCIICGTHQNIETHHPDYSKPLDIVWLCVQHHRRVDSGKLSLEART